MYYFPIISNSNKLVSGATLLLFLKLSSYRKHSEYSKQYRRQYFEVEQMYTYVYVATNHLGEVFFFVCFSFYFIYFI